jgi:hypothetical protein
VDVGYFDSADTRSGAESSLVALKAYIIQAMYVLRCDRVLEQRRTGKPTRT